MPKKNVDVIKTAAETITSMCLDFIDGGVTRDLFVANLERYAKYCREQLNKEAACVAKD